MNDADKTIAKAEKSGSRKDLVRSSFSSVFWVLDHHHGFSCTSIQRYLDFNIKVGYVEVNEMRGHLGEFSLSQEFISCTIRSYRDN